MGKDGKMPYFWCVDLKNPNNFIFCKQIKPTILWKRLNTLEL